MFRVYVSDTNLQPSLWTVTADASVAAAAYKRLLALDRTDGAAVMSRDGVAVLLSRFDMPFGAGRLAVDGAAL